jgi:membrane protease YdiL (CAAX protease family)
MRNSRTANSEMILGQPHQTTLTINLNSNAHEAVCDAETDYWSSAKRPFACLVFLFPLLLFYEIGVLWLGGSNAEAVRNGADFWMRGGLRQLGLDFAFLLPALVVAGLLGWHVHGKYRWRVSLDTLGGMLAESLLFAFGLMVLGQLQDLLFQRWDLPPLAAMGRSAAVARAVSFVGAGVYEEVLFRLLLLPAFYLGFRASRLSIGWAAGLAVLSSSLVFSLAHYIGPSADGFSLFSFTFRTLAGLFFAILFCLRGFGITVGCHAAYDLLVGVLLVNAWDIG